MTKKKIVPVYVVQFWKIKLTFRALVIIAVTTILVILCIKFGYDEQRGGCYSNPGNINVDIKKIMK